MVAARTSETASQVLCDVEWCMHAGLGQIASVRSVRATTGAAGAGTALDGWPFQTSGKIMAPVTLTRLADSPALQLLVSCFDGYFYVIDGFTACAGAAPRGRFLSLGISPCVLVILFVSVSMLLQCCGAAALGCGSCD
jgi:hypothetical protein